jgi:class 3 adenylate cyclase
LYVCADDENSQVLFAGPRVRMGIHWAREGTVAIRNNIMTRHKAYEGQAWSLVSEISDAANGGQVLLSEVRACVTASREHCLDLPCWCCFTRLLPMPRLWDQ